MATCIFLLLALGLACTAGELAPLSYIPEELVALFHPWTSLESRVLPGNIKYDTSSTILNSNSRNKRQADEDNVYYTVSHIQLDEGGQAVEETCMMIQTKAKIEVRYKIRPTGVARRVYSLPLKPDKVNGTCAIETETAKMFIFWPGFNLSLVFTKNPEGNSYYMNRAVVVVDKSHPALKSDFSNAASGGKVKLETIPDENFFWTPLGKSYSCWEAEDQGPLKLFNVAADEVEGYLELYQTRFQPFVRRAGGTWGPPMECLPRSIREVRDTMPFVCAVFVLVISGATVGAYALQRTFFTDQKINYGAYGGDLAAGQHEMEQVKTMEDSTGAPKPVTQTGPANGGETHSVPANGGAAAAAAPTANPFKQKTANPFQNYGST